MHGYFQKSLIEHEKQLREHEQRMKEQKETEEKELEIEFPPKKQRSTSLPGAEFSSNSPSSFYSKMRASGEYSSKSSQSPTSSPLPSATEMQEHNPAQSFHLLSLLDNWNNSSPDSQKNLRNDKDVKESKKNYASLPNISTAIVEQNRLQVKRHSMPPSLPGEDFGDENEGVERERERTIIAKECSPSFATLFHDIIKDGPSPHEKKKYPSLLEPIQRCKTPPRQHAVSPCSSGTSSPLLLSPSSSGASSPNMPSSPSNKHAHPLPFGSAHNLLSLLFPDSSSPEMQNRKHLEPLKLSTTSHGSPMLHPSHAVGPTMALTPNAGESPINDDITVSREMLHDLIQTIGVQTTLETLLFISNLKGCLKDFIQFKLKHFLWSSGKNKLVIPNSQIQDLINKEGRTFLQWFESLKRELPQDQRYLKQWVDKLNEHVKHAAASEEQQFLFLTTIRLMLSKAKDLLRKREKIIHKKKSPHVNSPNARRSPPSSPGSPLNFSLKALNKLFEGDIDDL